MRILKLPQLVSQSGSARFALLFDNSITPDHVHFLDGDESLRHVEEKLQKLEYSVKFPDVSSIKIIRIGTVSCSASECRFEIQPLNSMQAKSQSKIATTPQRP